jgi:Icc-related predicted phosphoesterase
MTNDEFETLGCPYCDMGLVTAISADLEPDSWNPIKNATSWSHYDRNCYIKYVYNFGSADDNVVYPEITDGSVRFACISDTHCLHRDVKVPQCDYLIHSGDITDYGEPDVMNDFMNWLRELKATGTVRKECIVVPGNHDVTLYPEFLERHSWRYFWDTEVVDKIETKDVIILRDRGVELDGIRIYGSPWVRPVCQWAYCSANLKDKFDRIPNNTDILITHSPAFSKGDNSTFGSHELFDRVQIVKPLVHVMGHVHFAYGIINDQTTYINAALANSSATKIVNRPIIFDLLINK